MSETYGTGLLTLSIVPKTPEDARKLTQALERLTAEDPAIQVRIDQRHVTSSVATTTLVTLSSVRL
jgi:translation elongation factor EF-G